MFLNTVRSENLAHLSYIFGDQGKAAVIDPRRDCDLYLDIAYAEGAKILYIFETHRNEDYVIGSLELARSTGAQIYHGKPTDFKYGNPVAEDDTFELGDIFLRILQTPGHTFESISIALSDRGFSEEPVAVFTGDALFIGDVGRTDFFPDRAEEVAGLLYDSIFQKLLPLGDGVILYPAHGAGSVCGAGMASREFSTLGFERRHNPVLQKGREEFIEYKVNENHYMPPYFRQMEKYNQEGPPILERLPKPKPYDPQEFSKAMEEGMIALDIRSPEALAGAYLPGSLAVPLHMIPGYIGWFMPYDREIGLVVENYHDVDMAVRHLIRLGYDNVACYMEGGMTKWETSGLEFGSIPAVYAGDLKQMLESDAEFTLLDVRTIDEFEEKRLTKSTHIYLGHLPDQLDKIPKERPIITFCGSGQRAIIAASILKQNGFEQVQDCLGSMAACSAVGCPITPE
jgi:hydroxyacylglutathione hydrolase